MRGRTIRRLGQVLIVFGSILVIIGCAWSPLFINFYIKYRTIQMTALTSANEKYWNHLTGENSIE